MRNRPKTLRGYFLTRPVVISKYGGKAMRLSQLVWGNCLGCPGGVDPYSTAIISSYFTTDA